MLWLTAARTELWTFLAAVEDLKSGLIRCVGNPIDRFIEDALRILRAVRFSAQLGFDIESETYQALRVIAPNLETSAKNGFWQN